jgi:opacity protein-like surface antigen
MALICTTHVFSDQAGHIYLALDAGILQANFNNNYLDQSDLIPQNISESVLQNGYSGGIALGYNHLLNQRYFFDLELAGNINSGSALYQSGAATAAFSDLTKIKNYVDLTIAPGLIINNAIFPYLKLGVSHASLHDNMHSPVGYTPVITEYDSNKNVFGFAAGLGVKYSLSEHITLFNEVNYHDYGTVNVPNFQNFSATYTHSADLHTYGLVVGAMYSLGT